MMQKSIFLATRNENKVIEIRPIMSNLNVELKSIAQNNEIPDAMEDGDTFESNAMKKALHYFNYLNAPVLADDSGLVVPALNGAPGIYSARYAGEKSNYKLNNQKLLLEMEHLKGDDRKAFFICYVVYKDKDTILKAEGKFEGRILFEEKGMEGFGYDPVFEVPDLGLTFAEIPRCDKNKISHRFLAFNRMAQLLNEYWQTC